MRLLAEMEVRRQDVLGEVYREEPAKHPRGSARTLGKGIGQHAEDGHREHESGAECNGGLDRPHPPRAAAHDHERAGEVRGTRRHGQEQRRHCVPRPREQLVASIERGIGEYQLEQVIQCRANARPGFDAQRAEVGPGDRERIARQRVPARTDSERGAVPVWSRLMTPRMQRRNVIGRTTSAREPAAYRGLVASHGVQPPHPGSRWRDRSRCWMP